MTRRHGRRPSAAKLPLFNSRADPVKSGLVASLARPDGNATGVNIFTTELAEKRLGLLQDLVPAASSVAVLLNPNFAAAVVNGRESQAAARAIGKEFAIFEAKRETEIEPAFAKIVQARSGALSSPPIRSSTAGAIRSLRWRCATQFRPFTSNASSRWPAA